MANVKFDDFLKRELQGPGIKAGFEKQNEQLVRAVAARQTKQQKVADKAVSPQLSRRSN
ncbi:hypothetical protein LZY01_00580 [Levilactobacillus zymae]|uniref:Uncharacterized protein n=1 Tax=Levilactobacillus zymae TaxID=267363 RepID=A0ABQ0WSY4_9LACO|nr:hypothetical protein [Levilactobacillus zymae]KRL15654.1 hypothetical protein FD38_GL000658 [Levilactobacillus zymae DSM 19395]GEO70890.1 hypothetical protein LZY01_00580 [Levilactobacillus zymae]